MLSGLAPVRLYVHPDEQVELLREAGKKRDEGVGGGNEEGVGEGKLDVVVEPEREWVLPTRLSEKWSLRRLAEVFDCVGVVPPGVEDEEGEGSQNMWRKRKRVVLATVDGDSTVVYYIVHDGVVKPRQN